MDTVVPAARGGMNPSQSFFHDIRGLRYHVRTWGDPAHPKLFLLHGWMDVSASFQFLVDCLQRTWHVIAPDWRGFGLTQWAAAGYWFPDYYADLDALLRLYQPDAPVSLVGHSMGGNIVLTYAGLRPERVRHVVSLDGLGMPRTRPDQAPKRYTRWLDDLLEPPRFRPYASFDEVAARLRKDNPRLDAARARFLAQHWARQTDSGEIVLMSDPRHKMANPVLFRIEELLACWRNVAAPVLFLSGDDAPPRAWRSDTEAERAERKGGFRDFREIQVADCGHMMHLDQPARVAQLIEAFLPAD